jgi:nucleotide-binding universal stress UspA family protein
LDRLTSIVVGIDFSPASATALAQGLRLAEWNRAKLRAVHVIDTLVVVELQEALSPLVQGIQDALFADARKEWNRFAEQVPGAASVDFNIAVNSHAAEMLAQVRDASADLLILGAQGHAVGTSIGPVAAQLLRRSPCRVLLAREGYTGPYRRVMACIDFSQTSRAALEAAVRVVAQDGGKLSVVHVSKPPWMQFHFSPPKVTGDPAFQDTYRASLQKRLEEFCRPGSPETQWVKPSYHILEEPGDGAAIIEFAARTSADLIVLGTHGRTNLKEALIGTTAERVVRGAPCSVLAVKPAD